MISEMMKQQTLYNVRTKRGFKHIALPRIVAFAS